MKKTFRVITGLFVLTLLFFAGVAFVHAQGGGGLISPSDQPQTLVAATGGTGSFKELALNIVNFFLFFLGFIATIMIIYGGIMYVTSGGGENVEKAKKVLIYAVIGIIVILLSFAVVNTILSGAGTANPAAT